MEYVKFFTSNRCLNILINREETERTLKVTNDLPCFGLVRFDLFSEVKGRVSVEIIKLLTYYSCFFVVVVVFTLRNNGEKKSLEV